MTVRVRAVTLVLTLALVAAWLSVAGVQARDQTPKRGGVLTSLIIEDPPGFLIHEAATTSILWPMMSCYSNLVLFDQQKPRETVESIVPELAERWSWQDNYRNLVFFLRKKRHVARRQAVHLPGRQVHLRRRARGEGRPRQAPAEPAQGVVRQYRIDRDP